MILLLLYGLSAHHLLCALELEPTRDAQYAAGREGIPWYVIPMVGVSTLLYDPLWLLGLKWVEHRDNMMLVNDRQPQLIEFLWRNSRTNESE